MAFQHASEDAQHRQNKHYHGYFRDTSYRSLALPLRVAVTPATDDIVSGEQHFILLNRPPSRSQIRLAIAVVFGILVAYLIAVFPLSNIKTYPVAPFLTSYATAIFISEALTAVLLFAQFSILRVPAILVIANGYLFTAIISISWFLTFPGVFGSTRVIGGLQSTVWLYFFWNVGFAMAVIGYALLNAAAPRKQLQHRPVGLKIVLSIAGTTTCALLMTYLCTTGEPHLPRILLNPLDFGPLWPVVSVPVTLLCVGALIALLHRQRSILDLWLIVVICVFLIDQLIFILSPALFSLGWYVMRIGRVIAASLILICLLCEVSHLYARMLAATLAQRREYEARRMAGDTVAAAIAHEVKQPLTAMITSADASFRFLDRSTPNLDRAKEALKRIVADGHRAGAMVDSIRANFRNDKHARTSVDVNELIRHALALERDNLQKHKIRVQAEPNMQLPAVRGNRVQLQQVLLNLITNAIYAMATKEGEPRVLSVQSAAHEGDGVVISVADTGAGVDSNDVDRIFKPLFTTKADGMGMGLSICRAIVEAHNGRLWVTQNTPCGAVFQFTLRANNSGGACA